ncbi:hypothetical protein DICVIV_02574 [Dictyocaulus viviparus]|uniref:Ionotropic glutamate receptor C-terminal domain-containing protein n=1 Tax=Dictyocaulus viviparus TaxID=29172 RepID=A0A0D8Y5F5_DICVI|nr:hypothetical protein DICVIV_02574 [Dictyocaulus viviparus]
MMESSMLEYYMERDCQLQSIGGLLDSKGYGIALPKGSPLREILSRTVLQLQESTILEAYKNKWWRDMRGIFYVLLTGLSISLLLALGEYCIESRHDTFRLKFTVLGKIRYWWRGTSAEEKVEKARNKLCNVQLDTAGQPCPNLMSLPSYNDQMFVVCDGSRRSRTSSTISREGLRRLSRMLPANHEQLIHNRLKNKDINYI